MPYSYWSMKIFFTKNLRKVYSGSRYTLKRLFSFYRVSREQMCVFRFCFNEVSGIWRGLLYKDITLLKKLGDFFKKYHRNIKTTLSPSKLVLHGAAGKSGIIFLNIKSTSKTLILRPNSRVICHMNGNFVGFQNMCNIKTSDY